MSYLISYISPWFIYAQGFKSEDEAIFTLDGIVNSHCRTEGDTATIKITRSGNPREEIVANYRVSFRRGRVNYEEITGPSSRTPKEELNITSKP
ncbi:MAG: hypothetical protein ACE5ES_02105 [Candidatus Nanoarchaeia archaeon]